MKLITVIKEESALALPLAAPKAAWFIILSFLAVMLYCGLFFMFLVHFIPVVLTVLFTIVFLVMLLFYRRGRIRFTVDEVISEIGITNRIGAYSRAIPFKRLRGLRVFKLTQRLFYIRITKQPGIGYIFAIVTATDLGRVQELLKQKVEGLEIKTSS